MPWNLILLVLAVLLFILDGLGIGGDSRYSNLQSWGLAAFAGSFLATG